MPPPPSSSSIPQLKILRAYARLDDASLAAAHLPPTIYFSHTRHTLTIFDAYPKALFHFLVMPRLHLVPTQDRDGGRELKVTESAKDLTSLRTLLQRATASSSESSTATDADVDVDARARAEGTLSVLADEAKRLQSEIEREMRTHYGFTWPIWVGFHAVPSMEHLHVHVISSDLISPSLKTKRHYNTFSPRAEFFLPLADVRAWFDDEHQLAKMVGLLAPKKYELRLKDALVCFRCGETAKNMPALKNHLQQEFDTLRKRETKSVSASRV